MAATKAAHDQKGLPVFSIYVSDVQDKNDDAISEDVQEKIALCQSGSDPS